MNYDRKIICKTLDLNKIQRINEIKRQNPSQNILVEIPNTRGISSNLLDRLDSRVPIRIAGAYDEEKVKRSGNVKFANGETGEYYTSAVIYTKNEVVRIISEMEKIEKGLEGQEYSQFEKLVYIYGRLKSGIMYDPKFESKPSSEIRSLRGFLTKQTVCAGYAVMLKEMLDRQGIECHYVEGKTARGGGHAWNIVTIDGKNYPIDLTWDNSKFRSGKSRTYEYLGQNVEKFKKTHIPYDNEPCKNYTLSEMNIEEIERVNTRMSREKEYQSTTYRGRRTDGTEYIIAQVGDDDNGHYRYYYADISKDGKISNQAVLFSKTNVAHFINEKKWGRKVPKGYEEAIDNVLFSKENIKDSLSRGTCYIGKVRKERSDNKFELVSQVSDISKPKGEQEAFRFPTKVFKREDGTSFIAQRCGGKKYQGINVPCYHIFEVVKENNRRVVKRNVVYTERDFFYDNRSGIANEYLSRERLDRKVREAGGYIGYYNKNNQREYNPELVEYFKSMESVNIKKKSKIQSKQKTKNDVQEIAASDGGDKKYICPNDILNGALKTKIGKKEIDGVARNIRETYVKTNTQLQSR